MNKLLSICIPSYNRVSELSRQAEFFVHEASLHKNEINLFFSDNCSVDNTWDYLDTFQEKHPWIHIHRTDNNLGLVGNLYELLDLTDSKYIWFISDDDIFVRGIVNQVLAIIKSNPSLGSIFINSELWKYDKFGDLVQEASEIIRPENANLRTDKYEALYDIFMRKNTALMWISAWVLDRKSVEDVQSLNSDIFHLTEPFLFAANSLNYGLIYITEGVYIKNGSKLASTWATNNDAVFKVHFLGFYNAIKAMHSLSFPKRFVSQFLQSRTDYLVSHNPTYFLRGLIKYFFTTISIIWQSSARSMIKLIIKLVGRFTHQAKMACKVLIEQMKVRYWECRYFCSNKILKKKLSYDNDNIIVSLTTYPRRMQKVYLTIESLFNQDRLPDKIILWLSKEEYSNYSELPKSIIALKKRGLVIEFVEHNYGPYKKLIYAYKKYPKATIITVDDDILYPRYWLSELLRQHDSTAKCIIAYQCKKIELAENRTSLNEYRYWKMPSTTIESFSHIPIGAYGVLYPPGSLHDDIDNFELFQKLSPMTDDIWFKAMAMLQNVKARQVWAKSPVFHHLSKSQGSALYHSNIGLGNNDKNLGMVFNYYTLFSLLEK